MNSLDRWQKRSASAKLRLMNRRPTDSQNTFRLSAVNGPIISARMLSENQSRFRPMKWKRIRLSTMPSFSSCPRYDGPTTSPPTSLIPDSSVHSCTVTCTCPVCRSVL